MTVAENKKIAELCEELKPYVAMLDELEEEVEKRRNEIKGIIGDCEEDIFAGNFKVSYKTVKSERIDSKKLKESYPDIASLFTKVSSARKLLIK